MIRWIYKTDALIYLTSENISLDNWEEAALKMLKAMRQNGTFYRKSVTYDRDILMSEFYQITEPLFQRLFDEVDEEQQLSQQDIAFTAVSFLMAVVES